MKKIIASLLLVAFFAFGSTTVNAQAKFGHINSNELLSIMPSVKRADSSLQAFGKKLGDQNERMMKELEQKYVTFQQQAESMSESVRETKAKEIQDLEGRIQQFQIKAEQDVAKKKEELYKPILEKAQNAIQDVAKANGYSYIFDTGAGAVLYMPDGDNVLGLVKTKLGI